MPIYEYRCEACGHVTEALVRSSRARKPKCGQCGSPKTSKIFSTFGVSIGVGSAGDFPSCSSCSSEDSCDRSSCAMGGCPSL